MKIIDVEPKIVSIPLDVPKFVSTRTISSREYLLAKVTTDEGVIGWGLTFSSFDGKLAIEKELKPLLLGEDPFFVEKLWEKMFTKTLRWGRRGIYIRAMSAIDIALWDINAKAWNQPLFKILGGYKRKVPVYASGGYYTFLGKEKEVEAITTEMKSYVEQGFSAAKMKIGGVDWEVDLKRIQAAREALGESRKLYLDINNVWTIGQITPGILATLAEVGVDWIEEPFMPDALEEYVKLKGMTRIPIATGEILSTRWDFKQLLENRAADVWQPDASVLGGVTEWKNILAMARVWNIPIAPHAMHEIHAQLAASAPEIFILEYFDTTGDIVNYGKLLKKPLKPNEGFLDVPEEPGVGMQFDEDLISKYEVKGI